MMGKSVRWLLLAAIVAGIAVILLMRHRHQENLKSGLAARLQLVVRSGDAAELSCSQVAAEGPLVLLALGQSNAANHGSLDHLHAEPLTLVVEGKCIKAVDPLPGGTGNGGSIWQRLPAALRERQITRPFVVSVLAVGASSIDEWTRPDSALRRRLVEHLASLRGLDLPPDLVLWQQGEADAHDGTSGSDYSQRLNALAAIIDEAGGNPPIFLARSTICRSPPNQEIRHAIESKTATDHRFRLGPDTDLLSGDRFRYDGCHLSSDGLASAARMWAASISTDASVTLLTPRQAGEADQAASSAAQSRSETGSSPSGKVALSVRH